jgi:multidrug resistance efflux pump
VTNGTLAIIILFGGGLLVGLIAVIANSDIGQSIADAIRHNSGANEGAAVRRELEEMRGTVEQLQADVDGMHAQLGEAQERLDFAERLLTERHEARIEGPRP